MLDIGDTIWAFFLALVPMAILSFVMMTLSDRAVVTTSDKPGDSKKAQKAELKKVSFLHSKWVSFGGGFYGLTALATFIFIETLEVVNFLKAATGVDYFIEAVSFTTLLAMFVESFKNMIIALVWFGYWPDHIDIGNGWVWLIMTYAGYQLGRSLSKAYIDRTRRTL